MIFWSIKIYWFIFWNYTALFVLPASEVLQGSNKALINPIADSFVICPVQAVVMWDVNRSLASKNSLLTKKNITIV